MAEDDFLTDENVLLFVTESREMMVRAGRSRYTIPLLAIRESIQVEPERVTTTMDGEELVKVREEIIPVVRLHELQGIRPEHKKLHEGLLVIVDYQGEPDCLFWEI